MGLLFTHHIIGRLNSSAFLVEQTLTTRIYPFSPLSGSEMKTFFKASLYLRQFYLIGFFMTAHHNLCCPDLKVI